MDSVEKRFAADIPPTVDERTRKDIIRRRMLDEERKQRIFNPKVRIMGVDVQALDQQVAEKAQAAALAARENANQDLFQEKLVQTLENYDQAIQAEHRAILVEENNFRRTQQRKEDSRDFDLNDPHALRKSKPIRDTSTLYDPSLGVSSGQQFEGEDHGYAERIAAQRAEARQAFLLQMREKAENSSLSESDRLAYERNQLALYDRIEDIKAEIAAAERANRISLAQENQQLADQRKELEALQKAAERDLEAAELEHTLNSDLMTERREQTVSVMAPGARYRPDHFKYYPKEFSVEVRETQLKQAEEKRQREAAELAAAKRHALELEDVMRKTEVYAQQEHEARREVARGIADALRLQSVEHNDQEKVRNEGGFMDGSYFEKFGATSR